MARQSRRRPVRGVIGWQRFPRQEFIKEHLLYQNVSGIKDTRKAILTVEKDIAKFLNGIKELTAGALQYALEPTFELSQEYCPVKTGRLKGSGYIKVTSTAFGPRGVVGYAPRNDPPYATWVHEHTSVHHEAPTRAKFLQAALEEKQGDLIERVKKYISDSVGMGVK